MAGGETLGLDHGIDIRPRPPAESQARESSGRASGRPAQATTAGERAAARVAAPSRTGARMAGDSTRLQCGGCHARAVFTQSGQSYGRLVRDFLDRHERCGGAVKITSAKSHA
jgi:hypothetical protein